MTKAAARVSPTMHAASHPGSRDASPPDAATRVSPADAEAPARRDPVQRDLFVQTIHKDPAARRGGSGSDRGSGGKSPQSPSPKPWSLPPIARDRAVALGRSRRGRRRGLGPRRRRDRHRHRGRSMGNHRREPCVLFRRSTSFTSTPGPKTRRGEGEEDGSDAREREARDMLRSELEHDKAQNALLRESNARYEARVAQLEAAVRAAAEQTRELRDALETARADESRRHGVVVAEGRRSGSAFELAFDFERRRVDERETFEPRNVAGMGIEREAFAAMERRARGGDAGDAGDGTRGAVTTGARGREGNGVSPNVSGVEGATRGRPGRRRGCPGWAQAPRGDREGRDGAPRVSPRGGERENRGGVFFRGSPKSRTRARGTTSRTND